MTPIVRWSAAAASTKPSEVKMARSFELELTPFDAARAKGLLGIPSPDSTQAINSGGDQRLSTNCSRLEAQSEALVSRRKLRTTLQQTCTRGTRAGARSGGYTAMLLHDRALCALYDTPGVAKARGAGGARKLARGGLTRHGRRKAKGGG